MEGHLAELTASDQRPFEEVLANARAGDGASYAELWHRHASAVAAFARARGEAEPDEITNDAFNAVFQRLNRFEGDEGGFRALLLTVARRRMVDEHRRRTRRPLLLGQHDHQADRVRADADQVRTPDDVVIGDHSVQDLLSRLTAEQRDVLVLRIVADLSLEETASVLGKRVGAVKALQRRGLDALRESCTQTGDET